ncbi:hypothetical protein PR202_ga28783 [Eleusine coracana subsp. coracana]|uniref:Uncharacterized protein n=1 Tax=Eleusine coracana subsp. coracana TaxID=191504 RepID=A0AAV5DJE7_ELECO|nr:hypothetical protein PR202_ga28783 [Eleusine coracana subsp. coracana]
MALPASSSGLFRFLSPRSRPQPTDIVAAATWGVFAGTAAIYLVQVRVNHISYRLPNRSLFSLCYGFPRIRCLVRWVVCCIHGVRVSLLSIGSVIYLCARC